MIEHPIQYRAKCPHCSDTYISDVQWKVCPVCTTKLKQIDAKRCEPVPKTALSPKEVYAVAEVAEMMGFHRDTITKLFKDEPGVIILSRPEKMHKKAYNSMRITRVAYERVLHRLTKRK